MLLLMVYEWNMDGMLIMEYTYIYVYIYMYGWNRIKWNI